MLDLKVTTWKDLKNNVITVSNTKIEVQKIAQKTWTNLEKGSILKQLLELCGVNSAEVSFVTSSITISEDSNNDNALQVSCAFTGTTTSDKNYIQGTMDCSKGYIYFKTANGASNYGLIKYEDNTFKINLEERKTFTFYFGYVSITADEHELYLWKGKSLRTLAEKQLNYLKDSVKIVDYIHQPGKANSDYGVSSVVDDAVSNNNVEIPVGILKNLTSIKQIENYTVNNTKGFQVFTFKRNEKNTLETELSGQYCFNGGTKFWPTQESTNNIEYWANNPQVYPEIVFSDWDSENGLDLKVVITADKKNVTVNNKMYNVGTNDEIVLLQRKAKKPTNHTTPDDNTYWVANKLNNYNSIQTVVSKASFEPEVVAYKLTSNYFSSTNDIKGSVLDSQHPTHQLYTKTTQSVILKIQNVSDYASYDAGADLFFFTIGSFNKTGFLNNKFEWISHCSLELNCSIKFPILINQNHEIYYHTNYDDIDKSEKDTENGDSKGHLDEPSYSGFTGELYSKFDASPGIFPNIIGYFGDLSETGHGNIAEGKYSFQSTNVEKPTYTGKYAGIDYRTLNLQMYFNSRANEVANTVIIWRNINA